MAAFPNTPTEKTYYGEFKILCPKCRAFWDLDDSEKLEYEYGTSWVYDGEHEIGEQGDVDILVIHCPNCGYERKV